MKLFRGLHNNTDRFHNIHNISQFQIAPKMTNRAVIITDGLTDMTQRSPRNKAPAHNGSIWIPSNHSTGLQVAGVVLDVNAPSSYHWTFRMDSMEYGT